jgi:hypothetical protein
MTYHEGPDQDSGRKHRRSGDQAPEEGWLPPREPHPSWRSLAIGALIFFAASLVGVVLAEGINVMFLEPLGVGHFGRTL